MLTSNLWTEVGLHNGAKGTIVDFVYTTSTGPRSGALPEAVVVQFRELHSGVQPFLQDVPRTVAISPFTVEWMCPNGGREPFIRTQIPLVLAWAFTIHKSQGKTLDHAVIDLGKSEKCCGMTLVALSRVRELQHLLLKAFSLERLHK